MFEADHRSLFYCTAGSQRRLQHQQPVGDIVATSACSRRQTSPPSFKQPSAQASTAPQTVLTAGVEGGPRRRGSSLSRSRNRNRKGGIQQGPTATPTHMHFCSDEDEEGEGEGEGEGDVRSSGAEINL